MKRYFSIIFLVIILLGLASSAQAITTIVKDYPELSGTKRPGEAEPGDALPQFIKYVFVFSLSIVGIIGLAAIVIAAFGYLTAVGNPQKAADANDKILSALLGIILLLGSFLLLRTINPDLLRLGVEAPPVTVVVSPNGNGDELTGCRFLPASWDKEIIDAGDSATLTISWDEQSCTGTTLKKVKLPIRQERYGTDLGCGKTKTEIENILKNSFPNNSPVTYTYTFNKHCKKDLASGINFPQTACMALKTKDPKLVICNYKEKDKDKNEPGEETFYIKGTIEVNGQSEQDVPELKIRVKDLDENGKCCR